MGNFNAFVGLCSTVLRPKQLIKCFLGIACITLNPLHQTFLLHFQYLHQKFIHTPSIGSLIWPSVWPSFTWLVDFWCTDWLLHIQKVRKFQKLLGYIIFINILFKKIKYKKPPSHIIS